MAETVLQTYLNQQFIKISDEGNIALLGKAVTTVYKNLQNKKQKVIPYTLVAINPSISETDPVVLEVEKTIIAKWKGFKNSVAQIKDKPTTYVRAVILAALSKLAREDGAYATIIWHSAQDILKYFKTGSEKQYLEQFLLGQGNKVQELAEVSWGDKAGQKDKMAQPEVELPNAKSATVDGEVLSNRFLMAAQHTAWKSHSGDIGDNPYTPNNQHWAKVFSEKAGSGLAREINAVFTKQGKLTNATLAGLDTYFKNMASFFGEISNTVISNAEAVHRRTDLLWWKESLYSKSLNCSYRKADKKLCQVWQWQLI